jgi:hypothetical protein
MGQSARIIGYQDGPAGADYLPGKLSFFIGSPDNTLPERMTINSSGNIGINLANPTTRLSVNSGVSAPTAINLANSIVIGTGNANANNKYLGQFGFLSNDVDFSAPKIVAYISAEATEFYTDDTKTGSIMRFFTGENGGSNPVERMVIDNRGYVGIGTTVPDQKLTINGTIHSREVKVDLNVPGPDYVFEPDYQLIELSKLKAYLDKNRHLPEIPSADQMAKDGLNLGEMNTKLLKKVEELTLYLIEKDKEDKEQSKSNASLAIRLKQQQTEIDELKAQMKALIKH